MRAGRLCIRRLRILALPLAMIVLLIFPGILSFSKSSIGKVNSIEIKKPCGPHLLLNDHTLYKDFTVSPETKARKRSEWQAFLNSIPERFSYESMHYKDEKGIIYAATGNTLERALLSIRMVRYLKCKLPIQIWYIEGEFTKDHLLTISAQYRVTAMEITTNLKSFPSIEKIANVTKSYKEGRNYHIKSLVILLSSFKEVLYLDSDNFPVLNPQALFTTSEYTQTGSIFWPDFWKFPQDNPMWEITKLECNDEYEQESGQLLINKEKSFTALLLSMFFQINHEFYFQLLLGDKDTFRLSWKITNTSYHMVPHPAAIGGRIRVQTKTGLPKFCGYTMLQFTPAGKLIFVHANGLKYAHAIEPGITFETIQYLKPSNSAKTSSYPTVKAFFAGAHDIHSSNEEYSSEMGCNEYIMHNFNYSTHGLEEYMLKTVPFSKFQSGKYAWVEKAYFELHGPGGSKKNYCGGGKIRSGLCENEQECCSSSGWCGTTDDHCSMGCRGGPCFTPADIFCGNGRPGNYTCQNELECCSSSGWCSKELTHCSKTVCIGGPCLR